MSRRFSAKRAFSLLTEMEGTLDTELWRQGDDIYPGVFVPFRLRDGRIFSASQGEYPIPGHPRRRYGDVVFDGGWSRDTPEEFLDEVRGYKEAVEEAKKGPPYILSEMLPGGQDFPGYVEVLIGELAVDLGLPWEKLDRSIHSLRQVERAMTEATPRNVLTRQVLAPITAYFGEVLRLAADGSWSMYLYEEPLPSFNFLLMDGETAEKLGFTRDGVSILFPDEYEAKMKEIRVLAAEQSVSEFPSEAKAERVWVPQIVAKNGERIDFVPKLAGHLLENYKHAGLVNFAGHFLFHASVGE